VTPVIVFVKGTSKSGWLRRSFFRSRRHPAFFPRGLGVALLFNCSLLRAALRECDGPFAGACLSVLLRPAVSSHRYRHIHWRTGPAFSLQTDGRPWNPSLRGYSPRLYHTEQLPLQCWPSYREVNMVAPRSASDSRIMGDFYDEHPDAHWTPSRCQLY
jgi:hypothetical protein